MVYILKRVLDIQDLPEGVNGVAVGMDKSSEYPWR